MTGNQSNITIFLFNRSHNNLEQMELTTEGPFQIINPFTFRNENYAKGRQWPKQDLIKYAVYLKFLLKNKANTEQADFNSWTFFRKLSIFIQSKNPNQCRILHKKMMLEHTCVEGLLSSLQSTIHKFQEWEQHYESYLNNLKTCLKRQKEEVQKELTNKSERAKMTFEISPKGIYQLKEPLEHATKDKDLRPTGTEYFQGQNESEFRYSKPQRVTKLIRPASGLFAEDDIPPEIDMNSWLCKPKAQLFNKPTSETFNNMEERIRSCQNTFQSYLGMLKDIMGGSVSNY